MKFQLAEKDKESTALKEKITDLRRNNQFLQSQVAIKSDSDLLDSKVKKEKDSNQNYPKGLKPSKNGLKGKENSEQKRKAWKKEEAPEREEVAETQMRQEDSRQSSYPKLETKEPIPNVIKWSH